MSAKHTPGPWASSAPFLNEGAPLFVTTMARTGSQRIIVCRIENSASGLPLDDEDIANAQLISVAPDLLEFAQEVRRAGDTRLASMAIALINRATSAEFDASNEPDDSRCAWRQAEASAMAAAASVRRAMQSAEKAQLSAPSAPGA